MHKQRHGVFLPVINCFIYYRQPRCSSPSPADLHCGNIILPKAKITPETLIFPSGPKALEKYEGFRSIFGLGQYDVTTVQSIASLHSTAVLIYIILFNDHFSRLSWVSRFY